MATTNKPTDDRPTTPSASHNPWEYPGWPSRETGAPARDSTPTDVVEGISNAPRASSSVAPAAFPVPAPEPTKARDLLPRIMTITAIVVTAVVVGVYIGRGPKPAGWAGRGTRLGAPAQAMQSSLPTVRTLGQPAAPAPVVVSPPPALTFDIVAADTALRVAEQRAVQCVQGTEPQRTEPQRTEPQRTNVQVTFGPAGNVIYVLALDRDSLGDTAASCIEAQFRGVTVPAFSGTNVTVMRRFSLP